MQILPMHEVFWKIMCISLDSRSVPLEDLHGFLMHHKGFSSLLENPQLIEHDSFTPLLQAVFHLTEELMARETSHRSSPC